MPRADDANVLKRLNAIVDHAFIPKHRIKQIERGKVVERLTPLFSTFCLADWDGEDLRLWHAVRGVLGVASILTHNERPVPCSSTDMLRFRKKLDDFDVLIEEPDKERESFGFSKGDLVRFANGPFQGYDGLCYWIDEDRGAKIKLTGVFREFEVFVSLEDIRTLHLCTPAKELDVRPKTARRGRKRWKHPSPAGRQPTS
jgi:transcription antitermination factor NusG